MAHFSNQMINTRDGGSVSVNIGIFLGIGIGIGIGIGWIEKYSIGIGKYLYFC